MAEVNERLEQDRQQILDARQQGTGAKILAYTKLSGPGWLQGAITLGGGSLAGSLYLGLLAGYSLMWLQPVAMILGIIMLSAIGYVTLSTGERPFDAINKHINPVLGWSWAIATLMANLVWCMPQFALGTAAIQQNLAPNLLGPEAMGDNTSKAIIVAILFTIATVVVWSYGSGGRGIKLFERLLKTMVGIIVLCFFGVVAKMTLTPGVLDWGAILGGFVPDFSMLTEPAASFQSTLSATGEFAEFWKAKIVSEQRDVMVTAAATAVGINMTFLLPYSMLRRGWDRDFRGLAMFDLSIGLFIPFLLATSCVVIASASQFHAKPAPGFLIDSESGAAVAPAKNLVGPFNGIIDGRIAKEIGKDAFADLKSKQAAHDKAKTTDSSLGAGPLEQARAGLPRGDRAMAAMLVKRDAFNLARSLEPLTGKGVAHYVFGLGVVGMAVSTIIILMLINGFVVCEMLGIPSEGNAHRAGCLLAGIVGASGPFLWKGDAKFWLAVPTSVFGMVLLPIAYFTFFLMMNSRSLLGDNLPTGGKRLAWNAAMLVAACAAAFGSIWSIWSKTGMYGIAGLGALIGLAVIVHFVRGTQPAES